MTKLFISNIFKYIQIIMLTIILFKIQNIPQLLQQGDYALKMIILQIILLKIKLIFIFRLNKILYALIL
jgi:hypothetical protein